MPKVTLNNVTVSDAYMALLADRGIDYWFANAGTDFAPVVETLAKAQVLETKVPTPVTCPHENTAMHMAIGYFLVTGRPQAVMVHVNVGTANGMNGLLNAARGHVPVLFTAGRTPTNEDGLTGHRSLDIRFIIGGRFAIIECNIANDPASIHKWSSHPTMDLTCVTPVLESSIMPHIFDDFGFSCSSNFLK